mgnify:CR=1 FL=1
MTVMKLRTAPINGNFNNLVDDFFASFLSIINNGLERSGKSNLPANISETATGYTIEMLVPGFDKEAFKIEVDGNLLTVSAETKETEQTAEVKAIRKEWNQASVKRSFTLDESIDAEKIDAKFNNGVLTLSLPKKPEVKPAVKQITVQ